MNETQQVKSNIPTWISVQEACNLLNVKEKTIKNRCYKGDFIYKIEAKDNIKQIFIRYSSLSISKKINNGSDNKKYSEAPLWSRIQADKYIDVIKKSLCLRGRALKLFIENWNKNNPDNHTSYSSLIRMRNRYFASGINGLLSRYGNNSGRTIIEDCYFEYFKNLYLVEGAPSLRSCWEQTLGYAMRKYGISRYEFPCHATFKRRLEREVPEQSRLMLKKEISTALIMYQEKYRLKTRIIDDWYDLGHTSGLIKAKNMLFNARCFNSISVDTECGLLTKTSTKVQKLEDEAFWYVHLPEELKIFTPRLVSFDKDKSSASLTQELYGYPSLQELYLSGEVNLEDWNYIIKSLFSLHKKFEKFKGETNPDAIKWLYYDKTKERLSDLRAQNPYWNEVLDREFEYINGKKYRGIASLKSGIDIYVQKLCKTGKETVIHGDYCFSNILFDSSNYNFKLVDPRGRLNNEPTIYGDPRYDIAKLRHSIAGFYDFIVHGLFRLKENKTGFEYEIKTSVDYSILEMIFNKYAELNGYNPQEIKFIEGLLFLSMIPLHKDNFSRQKVFYLKAIELLNDTVKIRGKLNNEKVLSLVRSRG